jgi:glycosyltransferase involved in cell wall biosynthesis
LSQSGGELAEQRLRLLVVHNRYRERGGEDVAVEQDVELFRSRGHEVALFERDNAEIRQSDLSLLGRTMWSLPTYRAVRSRIQEFRPDLVHVHNFLPLISPSVYNAAWAEGVPVVQSLENHRLVCAAATLYRAGAPCTLCVGGSIWQGVLHKCYRQSRAASLAVVSMLQVHRWARTWNRVEAFAAVSEAVREKVIAGGLPADRIHVRPNYTADLALKHPEFLRNGPGKYALYAGRLSPEKGVKTLVGAWAGAGGRPPDIHLKIAGSGPAEAELRSLAAGHDIEFVGRQDRETIARLLAGARLVICPSECFDAMPLAVVEAFAAGVPVLASAIGALATLVEDNETGQHFTTGDPRSLAAMASAMATDTDANARMGQQARKAYLATFTPERAYHRMLEIYAIALRGGRSKNRGRA